jgi:hypothetical protein
MDVTVIHIFFIICSFKKIQGFGFFEGVLCRVGGIFLAGGLQLGGRMTFGSINDFVVILV